MDIILVASIKISVEIAAESVISKYSIHNSKIRPVADKTANGQRAVRLQGREVQLQPSRGAPLSEAPRAFPGARKSLLPEEV